MENEVVEDFCKKFLRKVRNAKIIINLSSVNELKQLSEQNRFYNDILEINAGGITINPNWKAEIINDDNISTGSPIKVFFMGDADECEHLESRYGCLFINNKNLLSKWPPVRWDREVTELTPSKDNSEFTFSSWERLSQETHPFTEIMILDLYILEDNPGQRIDNNIIPLLRLFANQNGTYRKLKVTIIAERMLNSPNEQKYQRLSDAFEYINTNVPDIELSLIHYNKEKIRREIRWEKFDPEHDREIYTNFLRLKSGAGWNIFGDNGNINHRTTISIQSLLRNDVRAAASKAWNNLSVYREKIDNGEKKVLPGRFDENGNLLTETTYYHYPKNSKSCFLNN
ncbi:MAG: hypothetical protein KIT80_00200 [Chitinophagaceae bacterium]|nr:hypothetical protein [Chitinophagaceae bacterium]MCW5925311.1 hypothetical protein [Chitinophagaceae bacterium]